MTMAIHVLSVEQMYVITSYFKPRALVALGNYTYQYTIYAFRFPTSKMAPIGTCFDRPIPNLPCLTSYFMFILLFPRDL